MTALPQKMKQYVLSAPMDSINCLTLQSEVPLPVPAPGEILVKVHCCTLNARDIQVACSNYPNPAKGVADVVPLSDASLEVVGLGPDVPGEVPIEWQIGDRVVPCFMQGFHAGKINHNITKVATLGGGKDGFLREYGTIKASDVVRTPKHMTNAEASTLCVAALTSYNCLYGYENPLKAGDTVLILGTGGCSIAGLQMAVAAGAEVIVTSSSDEKLKRALALGAHHAINYRKTPDWDVEVRKITNGQGVDHIIEISGGDSLPKSIAACKQGGTVSIIGYMSDYNSNKPEKDNKYDISKAILYSGATIRGVFVGNKEQFWHMNRIYELHNIHPPVDKVFAFEDALEAYRDVQNGSHFNKVVIRLTDEI